MIAENRSSGLVFNVKVQHGGLVLVYQKHTTAFNLGFTASMRRRCASMTSSALTSLERMAPARAVVEA